MTKWYHPVCGIQVEIPYDDIDLWPLCKVCGRTGYGSLWMLPVGDYSCLTKNGSLTKMVRCIDKVKHIYANILSVKCNQVEFDSLASKIYGWKK